MLSVAKNTQAHILSIPEPLQQQSTTFPVFHSHWSLHKNSTKNLTYLNLSSNIEQTPVPSSTVCTDLYITGSYDKVLALITGSEQAKPYQQSLAGNNWLTTDRKEVF